MGVLPVDHALGVRAVIYRAGMASCARAAGRGDPGAGQTHGDGGVAGDGVGARALLSQVPSGIEPYALVGAGGQSAAAGGTAGGVGAAGRYPPVPWTQRVWALPFLRMLCPSERTIANGMGMFSIVKPIRPSTADIPGDIDTEQHLVRQKSAAIQRCASPRRSDRDYGSNRLWQQRSSCESAQTIDVV